MTQWLIFFKMNYCYLILMWQIGLIEFNRVSGTPGGNLVIPDIIRIVLRIPSAGVKRLNLEFVDSYLASENLPVWIMEGKVDGQCIERENGPKMNLDTKVMEKVGDFAFYHDRKTTTAAVYFHKRQQFDGMIDSRFLIQGLSMDRINTRSKTILELGKHGINRRLQSIEHPEAIDDLTAHEEPDEQTEIRRTYKNRVYNGYPEIIVVVSHELVQEILQTRGQMDDYAQIVSYVMTYMNGIDMLYSKLKETKIQWNLAGIIIASECETSTLTKGCFQELTISETGQVVNAIETNCVSVKLRDYFFQNMDVFIIESYDIVMYLARDQLVSKMDEGHVKADGFSVPQPIYNSMKENKLPVLVSGVSDDGTYKSYATAAHELAHLMYVPHDDETITRGRQCNDAIMKAFGSFWCKECLSWSIKSELAFKRFFSSADCVGFTNSPLSALPRRRRELLSADEQCQRYGFESATIHVHFSETYCQTRLQCQDEMGGVHDTAFPFLGTRCDHDKVCWQRQCLPIQTFPN